MSSEQSTRVAAIAFESSMGEPAANLDKIEQWALKAHAQQARFAVFPEECITGSLNKAGVPRAQVEATAARAVELGLPRLEALARRLQMTLVVGAIAPGKQQGGLRNCAWIIGPAGHLATYTKIHLPGPEGQFFEAGEQTVVVSSQGWKFSVGICYDLNFPEMFRTAGVAGCDFFLLVVGCSGVGIDESRHQRDQYVRQMYGSAVANSMYIFYSNQTGPAFAGLAFAMDPTGALLDSCVGQDGMIVTEVSRPLMQKLRRPAGGGDVRELRPEAYARPLIVAER